MLIWMAALLVHTVQQTASIVLQAQASPAQTEQASAEEAVRKFYDAFYKHDWDTSAEQFHPDARKMLHGLMVHIAQTTDNPKERKEFPVHVRG